MIFLHHRNAKEVASAYRNGEELECSSRDLSEAFWSLCNIYPEELIIWIDDEVKVELNDDLTEIFPHDLVMSSYSIVSQYLPETIGYVDQLPFVNPDYDAKYPTWRMSTDLGGIKAKTALQFQSIYGDIKNFGLLLNSMARTGQQNSLFCYSDPSFVKTLSPVPDEFKASTGEVFNFVAMHYKREWLLVLLFCYWKFEKKFPVFFFLHGLGHRSFFKKIVDLSSISLESGEIDLNKETVDVIIPTMGRPGHLKNVLEDLKSQDHQPSKVIIVEQEPDRNSQTQLDFLVKNGWPFEIVHHFIRRTGACNARNLALQSVNADYVFFADDDIRFPSDLLSQSLKELNRLKVGALNLNCLQPSGKTIFHKIKQWGAFGSGTSIVKSEYALKCKFAEVLEHGFGEDIDYGLKLRSQGSDIIYHPRIKISHLKADIGGFRGIQKPEWEKATLKPKPSPTMMLLVKRYYSVKMMRGYKVSLFLKYYREQPVKNPFHYFKLMQERWNVSEEWAKKLLDRTNSNLNSSHE
ncbi:glycosyltransferase family A protein [Gramella sp. AN32]|uniref:Glycosyltransferase family 2 protein n=1 Tax=Christiangramia antarctica TaxID=2058158 RepID=A0ABW5X9A1_9FLAO|nr:glycosyltransferase family A protein [Gramella sp. AN32]MCM4154685.1 glycosyl transferase [Gramella sp. AN32]